MVLVKTYHKILKLTNNNPVLTDEIEKIMVELENQNIVKWGKDWTEEELVNFCKIFEIELKEEDNMVEYEIVTDENEYIDSFDDIIYTALKNIGKMKGIDIENKYKHDVLTNEMLGTLRSNIIEVLSMLTDNRIDLSPPEKEYNLGDKVSLYHNCLPATAIIIRADDDSYGLLIDGKYELAYVIGADSPTNYMIELQKRINVE